MLKPMLATDAPKQIDYPVYASYKIDGIRAIVQDGLFISRSLKPLPNEHLQSIDKTEIEYFDGELVFGDPTSKNEEGVSDCCRKTTSAVMSKAGKPKVTFYVFDHIGSPAEPYAERLDGLRYSFKDACVDMEMVLVEQKFIENESQLIEFEEQALEAGYEGLIVRSIMAPYKHGRSTAKQGYLLKVKRFVDSEAEVLEVIQQTTNQNAKFKNELGQSQRSHAKAGLVPVEAMGAIRVKDLYSGQVFNIGTGFTGHDRSCIWENRQSFVGKLIKYKHFPIGAKDLPRMPVFLGERSKQDLS